MSKTMLKASRLDQDPTKQSGNRKRMMVEIRKRLNGAYKDVMSLYKAMPKKIIENRRTYEYLMDDMRSQSTYERIRDIINDWFDTNTTSKPRPFFLDSNVDYAYDMGTTDSMERIRIAATQSGEFNNFTLSQLQFERVYQTPLYIRRVELVYGRLFNEMQNFSGTLATDLSRVLSEVVTSGQSPRVAQRRIKKQFQTSNTRAERIARTEINRAYTIARTENAEDVSNRLEIDVRVIHRSSLMASTRFTHGRRHGEIFTIQAQNDWWAEGSNRINCLCSIAEVVVGKDGKPRNQAIIKRMEKQKAAWFPSG